MPIYNNICIDGSGESFLFKIDSETGEFEQYKWTGENEYFIWSNTDKIAMGGGGHGFGFVLDSDFATGESFCCATYRNSMLVNKEGNGSFHIKNVECWGFEGLFGPGIGGDSTHSNSNSARSSGRNGNSSSSGNNMLSSSGKML